MDRVPDSVKLLLVLPLLHQVDLTSWSHVNKQHRLVNDWICEAAVRSVIGRW